MSRKGAGGFGLIVLLAILAFVGANSVYVVNETQQVIITQFEKPVGEPVLDAGLHFRTPFIQKPNYIEKRILEWDGVAADMPTQDKLYITVDTFARWRIKDALTYYEKLRDERSAQSRLDDILGSETLNAVAKNKLVEVVRSDKDREPQVDTSLSEAEQSTAVWLPIERGRSRIEEDVFNAAADKLKVFGIELLDIRFKRINYTAKVQH